jgi:hypothetical protein
VAFDKARHASTFKCTRMHKHISSTIVRLNEAEAKAEALLHAVKFHFARNHQVVLFVEGSAVPKILRPREES